MSSSNWLAGVGGLLFLLASLVPAIAIGWSRGFIGPLAGTATRYGYFLFPIAAASYFAFLAFDQRRFTRAIPILLCLTAAVGLKYNLKKTYETAIVYHTTRENFTNDVHAGMPLEELLDKYSGQETSHLTSKRTRLAEGFRGMKKCEYGVFAEIVDGDVAENTTTQVASESPKIDATAQR